MLNFKDTEDQKVLITSDPHWGHNRDFVYGTRGFSSVEEHDNGVINSINETARPNDILIILGDLCLNTTAAQFDAYLDRIQCQNIYCLWGNHNNPHEKAVYRKIVASGHQYPVKYKNLTYLGHYVEAALNGQFTIMLHYPILIWNEMQHGSWMLCGHSHYGCPQTRADCKNGKILDVGWDGHRKPWTLPEIAEVMKQKEILVLDHHKQ